MPCSKSIFPKKVFAVFFVVLLFIAGCALKAPSPPQKPSPEAALFLSRLARVSHLHSSVKGIGRFKVRTMQKVLSGRMAWIAQQPDRLRLTILDPAGRPAALLATDGVTVWLDIRAEDKHYVKKARRFSLKRMVGIDVTLKDVIRVLLGGVPLRHYHRVEVTRSAGLGTALFFSSEGKPVTVLKYQENPFFITRADYVDRMPALFLRLTRKTETAVELPQYPKELDFEDETQNRFYLRVDRFWADPQVDPDLFQLQGFGS